jgi:6-pyruvoyl-tetrahydropterin synthase
MKHAGKCRFLHGHNALVTATITEPEDPMLNGMVLDFGDFGDALKQVLSPWDHRTLLHHEDYELWTQIEPTHRVMLTVHPTAEELARMTWGLLSTALPDYTVTTVRWQETQRYAATYVNVVNVKVIRGKE